MNTTVRGVGALVFLAALVLGCSSSTDSATPTTTSTTEPASTESSTTVPPTTTSVRTITEVEFVPAPEFSSPGTITIGSRVLEFAFECFTEGAGDVLAIGVGTTNGRANSVQAIVQAFVGSPYVAVVDDDSVLELAIDRPAELFVQNSTILGSALRFVEAGETPGEGVAAGLGSVTVECQSFAFGLPEGFPLA